MANVTTAVIYPAIGFLGSTKCVCVHDKSVEEVRAMGRTDRERFDLATEVKAHWYRGVATPQVNCKVIPKAFLASWSVVSAA
jgi:hypothetical protein